MSGFSIVSLNLNTEVYKLDNDWAKTTFKSHFSHFSLFFWYVSSYYVGRSSNRFLKHFNLELLVRARKHLDWSPTSQQSDIFTWSVAPLSSYLTIAWLTFPHQHYSVFRAELVWTSAVQQFKSRHPPSLLQS